MEGNDHMTGLCLYTDGSKLNNNSGYGAVCIKEGEVCDETYGSIGPEATVFQAECYAIIHGLDLVTDHTTSLSILTDNQSVVHSLKSKLTTNKTVQELKHRLNSKSRSNCHL